MEIVKIPTERVPTLIGEKGFLKKQLEKICDVRISVSSEGEVEIDGDTTNIYFTKDVIKAIGRGFIFEHAIKIYNENYHFFLIDLKEFISSDKGIARLKGRVIGEKGKMKKEIEAATETYLSIYGNTVGIISKIDTLEYAKEAVYKILAGSQLSSVFDYLARAKRRIFEERLRG